MHLRLRPRSPAHPPRAESHHILPLRLVHHRCVDIREYWTIYRGPGFFDIVWFSPSLPPAPLPPFSKFFSLPVCRRSSLPTRKGGESCWGKSQIIRRWQGLVIHKSFNSLWFIPVCCGFKLWCTGTTWLHQYFDMFSRWRYDEYYMIRMGNVPDKNVFRTNLMLPVEESSCQSHFVVFWLDPSLPQLASRSRRYTGTFLTFLLLFFCLCNR
jgi:hypothetical protein